MKIHPDTLRTHRNRRTLSQEALAALSHVSKKTISRIEGRKVDPDKIRATTIERLAGTLGIKPEVLARAPEDNADRDTVLRDLGYRKIKTYIDGQTALAYALVERRYKVSIQSQIEMAPLFFALLAEGSLAWRREMLKEVREAADRLHGMEKIAGHLSFAKCAHRAQDGAAAEEASIEKCDLFGKEVGKAIDFDYDSSVNNPFADYLRKLAADIDPAIVELDPLGIGLTGWKTSEGMPEYEVGRVELDRITGEDPWAKYALEHGHARIRDIPEELQKDEASKARIAWLTDRIPHDEIEKQKRRFSLTST